MHKTNCSDQDAVVAGLRANRPEALKCLMRKVFDPFCKFCHPIAKADAEDIFYGVLERIVPMLLQEKSFRNFYGLVYCSAINAWRRWNQQRRKGPQNLPPEDFSRIIVDFELPPIEILEEQQAREGLFASQQECFNQLTKQQQDLLLLRIVEKRSREDIAQALGYANANVVGVTMNQLLRRMRQCIIQKGYDL